MNLLGTRVVGTVDQNAAAFIAIFSLLIYLLPAIIAAYRNHPHSLAILALDLFAGWTFAGWMVALVWSCIDLSRSREANKDPADSRTSPSISS
jgi:hypothetical protein